MKQFSVSIDEADLAKLVAAAKEADTSTSRFVYRLIRKCLKDLESTSQKGTEQ